MIKQINKQTSAVEKRKYITNGERTIYRKKEKNNNSKD